MYIKKRRERRMGESLGKFIVILIRSTKDFVSGFYCFLPSKFSLDADDHKQLEPPNPALRKWEGKFPKGQGANYHIWGYF